jgi:hypothetical protein
MASHGIRRRHDQPEGGATMATSRRRKSDAPAAVDASERFAAMSQATLAALRKPPRGKATGRAGVARAAPGATTLAEASAQALALGRRQAEWVIDEREQRLTRRSRNVAAATRSAPAQKAAARRLAAPEATAVRAALATRAGPSRGVLIAEGDSWFDYPFHDVLKELDDEFGWEIESVAHKGDTVEGMAYGGGQLDDFVRSIERVVRRGQVPRAILLSGGGNDVAGDWFGMLLNHRNSPVGGLNPAVVDGVLALRVRVAYTTILAAVTAACERLLGAPLPILVHGYDHPVPDGRGFLGGWGFLPGPWLAPGFLQKGYADLGERIALARELIERFYAMLGAVVALPAFRHVTLVDLRGALSTDTAGDAYRRWWANELHPTREGFVKVAGMFDARL